MLNRTERKFEEQKANEGLNKKTTSNPSTSQEDSRVNYSTKEKIMKINHNKISILRVPGCENIQY